MKTLDLLGIKQITRVVIENKLLVTNVIVVEPKVSDWRPEYRMFLMLNIHTEVFLIQLLIWDTFGLNFSSRI